MTISDGEKILVLATDLTAVQSSEKVVVVQAENLDVSKLHIPPATKVILCLASAVNEGQKIDLHKRSQKEGGLGNSIMVSFRKTHEDIVEAVTALLGTTVEQFAKDWTELSYGNVSRWREKRGLAPLEKAPPWFPPTRSASLRPDRVREDSATKVAVPDALQSFETAESEPTPKPLTPSFEEEGQAMSYKRFHEKGQYTKRDICRLFRECTKQKVKSADLVNVFRKLNLPEPGVVTPSLLASQNTPRPRTWIPGKGYEGDFAPQAILDAIMEVAAEAEQEKLQRPLRKKRTKASNGAVRDTSATVPAEDGGIQPGFTEALPTSLNGVVRRSQVTELLFPKEFITGEQSPAEVIMGYALYAKKLEEEYQSMAKVAQAILAGHLSREIA